MEAASDSPTDLSRRRYLSSGALLTLILFSACTIWALTMPAFQGPDEVAHYNSVSRLVNGGGWPEPYRARILGTTWQAVGEASGEFDARVARGIDLPEDRQPGERSTMSGPSELGDKGRDQMVQHPPGYYLLNAGLLKLIGAPDIEWDTALVVMRILSALLTGAAIPCVIGVARRLSGGARAGLVGAGSVLAIPFFATNSGYVNNDSLLILTASATLYCALRAGNSRHVEQWLLAAGLCLGAALFTKGLALFLIPVVGLFSLLAVRNRGLSPTTRFGLVLLPQAVAFVAGGWWWLRNLLTLGSIQPSQCAVADRCSGLSVGAPESPDFVLFTVRFGDRFSALFWGRASIPQIAYPERITIIASLLLVIIVLAAIFLAKQRLRYLTVLLYPVGIIISLYANAYSVYLDLGVFERGVQGRYVFSAICVIAASVAIVAASLRLRGRAAESMSALALLGAAGIAIAGWLWVLLRVTDRSDPAAPSGLAQTAVSLGVSPWLTIGAIGTWCIALLLLELLLLRPNQARPSTTPRLQG